MAYSSSVKTTTNPPTSSPHYAFNDTSLSLQYLMFLLRWPRPAGLMDLDRVHRWIAGFAPKASQVHATPAGHVIIQTQPTQQQVFMAELTTPHTQASDHPQPLKLDTLTGQVSAINGATLGAESSVGIWLLLNQLYCGVPGTYVFWHTQDDHADLSWLPLKTQRLVFYGGEAQHQLIQHIQGHPTASTAFTQHLLAALHHNSTLSLTATAIQHAQHRVDLLLDQVAYGLPEVVRLSSGAFTHPAGHSAQDLHFAATLAHQLVRIPWARLPVERDPQACLADWREETTLDFEADPRPF